MKISLILYSACNCTYLPTYLPTYLAIMFLLVHNYLLVVSIPANIESKAITDGIPDSTPFLRISFSWKMLIQFRK